MNLVYQTAFGCYPVRGRVADIYARTRKTKSGGIDRRYLSVRERRVISRYGAKVKAHMRFLFEEAMA